MSSEQSNEPRAPFELPTEAERDALDALLSLSLSGRDLEALARMPATLKALAERDLDAFGANCIAQRYRAEALANHIGDQTCGSRELLFEAASLAYLARLHCLMVGAEMRRRREASPLH